MSQFSNKERKIARLLHNFPSAKKKIKYLYQYINYFLTRQKDSVSLHEDVLLTRHHIAGKGSFWGYYDKSPVRNGDILFNSFSVGQKPRQCSEIDIILNGHKISQTNTWNFQQGCMLTWVDNKRFIHNYFDGTRFCSKIINKEGVIEKKFDDPIYAITTNGRYALTLNFTRLANLRPDYGYFNKDYKKIGRLDFHDGVYIIDLKTGKKEFILSLNTLFEFKPKESMLEAYHKVNHLEFSPSQKRFMLLHRWYKNNIKYSRLITCDMDGQDLYCLADEDMVSHCTWKNKDEILGWMRKNGKDAFYLLTDKTNKYFCIGSDVLKEDGHPSFSSDEKWLLLDTYPDKKRMSKILLYNMDSGRVIKIGQFLSPMKYTDEYRCDLHPRWNPDDKRITFDSVHEGIRSMYELDLSNLLFSIQT